VDIVVVYESLFGNTRVVAESIAAGARTAVPHARVTVVAVAQATPELTTDAALVVAGGPTHVFGMSRSSTRTQGVAGAATAKAADHHPLVEPGATGPGIREWLADLPSPRPATVAAAFDTRLSFPLAGGAARKIAHRLRSRGYRLAAKPNGFIVEGSYGPLRAGELDRAAAWGAELAQHVLDSALRSRAGVHPREREV
jgi:hypothetical protein